MLRPFFAVIIACGSLLHAQEASTPEPQYGQQYNALVNGQLVVLERQTAVTDTKSRHFFVISPSTKVFESINNPASPIRVGPNTHFIVRLATGDRDPQTMIHLQKLTPGNKDREVPIVTYKASLIPGGGVNHKRAPDEPIPVTIQKYGSGSLEIIPQQPLEAGEYAFMTGHEAQCFGVDAGLSSGSTLPTPARAEVVPPPPLTWVPKPISDPAARMNGAESRIAGTAEAGPIKGPARLIMSCETRLYDTGPQATATATIEVHPNLVDFDTDGIEGVAMVDNGDARSQLGSQPQITLDAGYMGKSPNGNPLLMIEYPRTQLKQVVDAPGTILTATVMAPENKGHALVARFALPADAAPLQAMMAPCFDRFKAEAEKAAAARLVFCPDIASMSLTSADVLAGANERKLPVDPDDDTGSSYPLPKSTKARPRPALKLACHYSPAAGSSAAAQTIRKLPIPAKATICTINERTASSDAAASCQ